VEQASCLFMTEVQKENSSVVEQASCLFMTEVQKENSSVVEQASCLFMTEVQKENFCCGTGILPVDLLWNRHLACS
jgi:hypothetical protein